MSITRMRAAGGVHAHGGDATHLSPVPSPVLVRRGWFCQLSRHLLFIWHSVYTRTSDRRAAAGDEGGGQPEQAQDQLLARHKGLHRRGPVHRRRPREVPLQGLVFPVMPALAHLLGQAHPVAHHALDQVVRHPEARLGPVAAVLEVPPAEEEGEGAPAQEQERVKLAPRAHAKDHRHHMDATALWE
jgi:hypothetical protein